MNELSISVAEAGNLWVRILSAAEVPEGEVVANTVGGKRIAVYNLDGEYYATDDFCSHGLALLSEGWIEDGLINCPLHMGTFCPRTGRAVGSPAKDDIATYRTKVQDGEIFVAMPAFSSAPDNDKGHHETPARRDDED